MSRGWCAKNGEWDGEAATWKNYNARPKEKSALFARENGTGPFKLASWEPSAKKLRLSRFEGYWAGPAKIQTAIIQTVNEFGTRRLLLEAGDADIIDVPRPFASQLAGLEGVALHYNLPRLETDPVFFFTFKINSAANPDVGSGSLDGNGIPPDFFSDPDVRKGFAYSFNYDRFLAESLGGKAARASGPVPPGLAGHVSTPKYDYNPQKAAGHFKKALGGKVWEKGFRFTMTFNTGSEVRQLACEILKKNVEALNPRFRINLRGIDWPSFLERAQTGKMPLFARGWTADYPDAHNFAFPFLHSQGRYPTAQSYKNPALDSLIEKAAAETDPAKRLSFYEEIQKLAYADAPQIYTVHPLGLYALRGWLKGFCDNPVFMGIYLYPLSK